MPLVTAGKVHFILFEYAFKIFCPGCVAKADVRQLQRCQCASCMQLTTRAPLVAPRAATGTR